MTNSTGNAGLLQGRRTLITGASAGIGRSLAHAFAAAGSDVVVHGRRPDEVRALSRELTEQYGVQAVSLIADLAEVDAPDRLAADALTAFGGLDILINNAGLSFPEPVTAITVPHFDLVLDVNLRAAALLAARIGAAMAAAGGGSIVNISSAAGIRALPEHYSYSIAKAGLAMATRVLALELGGAGVRVNSLSPTVVLTEMGRKVWLDHPEKAAPMLARIPMNRFVEPHEVADAAVFLASDAAAMINGVDLPVDGGYLTS